MKFLKLLGLAFLLMAGCNRQVAAPALQTPASKLAFSTPITVGGTNLRVFVANSAETQQQGLSGQERITDTQGMLFDFTQSARSTPSFWMKDMLFDLDIIWIKDGKILAIEKNVPRPQSNASLSSLPNYAPPSEIDYVLEVNAGWSDGHGISIGDKVTLK